MRLNENYSNLKKNYLFSEIAHRVSEFQQSNPEKEIISMGIGDVTRPLCKAAVTAMQKAVKEMSKSETFRGYGPEHGYDFLRKKIQSYYSERNVTLNIDEIFVSDGAKSDLGNILDLFDRQNTVLLPDPVYPVYADTNIMDGRDISFINATEQNGFLPLPTPGQKADMIYLCSPDNPTGAVYNAAQLKQWVDFANTNHSVILFDAAYEAFVSDESLPRSIFEIDGAKTCAIEFCSFSKTAGFTGMRCGYTVIPKELVLIGMKVNEMWLRRQTTKFNGVSYITQRAAEAVLSKEGREQIKESIDYYRKNAAIIMKTFDRLKIPYTGGVNSPYIWLRCPYKMKSWDFFDFLLKETAVVGTPGVGFGLNGEGYFRLTAFSNRKKTEQAMQRLITVMMKK